MFSKRIAYSGEGKFFRLAQQAGSPLGKEPIPLFCEQLLTASLSVNAGLLMNRGTKRLIESLALVEFQAGGGLNAANISGPSSRW